ncbi:MAG: hypothetical protein H0W72_16925 [Planctomycetes bacterium]|nr:hypothetical protein [Planctomycetota bacterium]
MPDEIDADDSAVRLRFTIEQLRDPIMLGMGRQLAIAQRAERLANEENDRLRKENAQLRAQAERIRSGAPIVITAKHDLPKEAPMTIQPGKLIAVAPKAPKTEREKGRYWVVEMLRERGGTMTITEMARARPCTSQGARQAMLNAGDLLQTVPNTYPMQYRLRAG